MTDSTQTTPPASPTALASIEAHIAVFVTSVRLEVAKAELAAKTAIDSARAEGAKLSATAQADIVAVKAKVASIEAAYPSIRADASKALGVVTAEGALIKSEGFVAWAKTHVKELGVIAGLLGAGAAAWHFLA